MSYIARNLESHEQVRSVIVPYHWRDFAAWRLIAELSRRMPSELEIIESIYVQGIPDTVWYVNRKTSENRDHEPQPLVLINSNGSVTLPSHVGPGHACEISQGTNLEDPRLRTLDLLFAPDFKSIVLDVENCTDDSGSLVQSPPTQADTISQRVIASALSMFLHSRKPLRVKGFYFDKYHPRFDLLGFFPDLEKQITPENARTTFDQIFFLHELGETATYQTEPGEPILALDLKTGTAYSRGEEFNLMKTFVENNRDIEATAFEVVKKARRRIRN
jgi:hypothetical protein